MTTTRDPLAVLRDCHITLVSRGLDPKGADAMNEAIAQVEALAEVANRISLARIAFVDRGVAMKGSLFAELNAKLQPFTPGQDSEGGGHE